MTCDTSRRRFLGTGTVVATGLAVGAFTRASLAADPREIPSEIFVKRADKRLTEAEIRSLVVGRTMMGVTYKGQEYLAFFDPAGKVDKMVDTRRETGDWKIEDGALAFKFPTLADGQAFSLRIYRYGPGPLHKGWSPSEKRWVWFVTEAGKAREFG